MEDLWLMVRILLIVLAWGGLLLLAGFGLEMASRVFGRGPRSGLGAGADEPADQPAAS